MKCRPGFVLTVLLLPPALLVALMLLRVALK